MPRTDARSFRIDMGIEQGYVEPVGRSGATSAIGDFQHVAIHREKCVGVDLMHDALIASAQEFPAKPEMQDADGLQRIREHRIPYQLER